MNKVSQAFVLLGIATAVVGCDGIADGPDKGAVGTVSQALSSEDRGLLVVRNGPPQPLRGVFFFAGSQNDGSQYYEYKSNNNRELYTVTPVDDRHLKWSDSTENQLFALSEIEKAGANVVVMSYWGARGTDYWKHYAPMQTSTYAHDELFKVATRTSLVIMPAIESYDGFILSDQVARYDTWPSHDPAHEVGDFGSPTHVDNSLLGQLEDLTGRYIHCAGDPAPEGCSPEAEAEARLYANHWAQIVDKDGVARFAFHLPFVCPSIVNHDVFGAEQRAQILANSLDRLADIVFQRHHLRIGFTIDPIDHENGFCRRNGPLVAEIAGPMLLSAKSVLAIQPFRDEAPPFPSGDPREGERFDPNSARDRASRKHAFIKRWVATGIPVYLDTNSGYDAHLVFKQNADPAYGNNDEWRNLQSQLKGSGVRGITFNAWNGYTEGWAGMENCDGLRSSCVISNKSTASWLRDNFASDPRVCDSVQYENGVRKHTVIGEICKKWTDTGRRWFISPTFPPVTAALGGSLGSLGDARTSEESVSCVPDARVTYFDAGVVMWSPDPRIGAHEVHGLIAAKYAELGEACSFLRMPTSDEHDGSGGCRYSEFEGGHIEWCPGETSARAYPY